MRKRLLSFVLAVLMIASLLPATALAADIVDSGTCGAEGDGSNLTWTLDSNGVLTISGTGEMEDYVPWSQNPPWYNYFELIYTVTISNGVTKIGDYFLGSHDPEHKCEYLTHATIPESVKKIGDAAFKFCRSMENIVIPQGVTSIGSYAFSSCDSLKLMTIPSSVETIGEYAFNNCNSLSGIFVDEENKNYSSDTFGVLFNYDKTSLICCPETILGIYKVPESVESIEKAAFLGCTKLTGITIPDGLTTIEEMAFYDCGSLKELEGQADITTIGSSAFTNCVALKYISIPNSVTSIGGGAFSGCESLTSVEIPDSVTNLEGYIFEACYSLESVTIGNGISKIRESTFLWCKNLKSIVLPSSVVAIADGAFMQCNSLKDVFYGGTEDQWQTIAISSDNDPLKNAAIHYNVSLHHFGAWTVTKAATCTEAGSQTRACTDAGCTQTETVVLPALGHAWDSGTVTKEPTATETGVRTYTCTRCKETKTESIPVVSVDVTQMFTDVEKNWAYPGIQYCVTHGIMGGMGDGTFAPTGTTTRAQIVQILYNLEGTPAVSGTTPFTDLTANWYKPAILWAYQNNVVAGKSPTTFDPEGPVTREQIAVILTQYMFNVLKMERTWTPADLSTFPDGANVSSWAKEAMQDAVALGLINGTKASDGLVYLDPQGSAARQQVATILMNFCQNVKK